MTTSLTSPQDPPPASLLMRWLGRGPVDQGFYVRSGALLMALKYAIEAGLVAVLYGAVFDPLMFVLPSLEARRALVGTDLALATLIWAIWSLPFIWIAASMTLRRCLDCGWSPLWTLLIFVPVVNLLTMLAFAFSPSREPRRERDGVVQMEGRGGLWTGVFLAVALAAVMLGLAVYAVGDYGLPLMVGTPVAMGMVIGVLGAPRHTGCVVLPLTALGTLGVVFLLMLALGYEGAICLLMMAPLSVPLVLFGNLLGMAIARSAIRPRRSLGGVVLLLPLSVLMPSLSGPHGIWSVTTQVVIEAPIQKVWDTVVAFPDLPPPRAWYFRAGIAAPMRARIEGHGIGAIRHCEFTTGDFVEPITAWEEPTLLAFDVREQPAPMFELSPYHDLHPPHLDGTLRSVRGEFRLERLGPGRTLLSGTTWYQLEMQPLQYWQLWSDWLIQAIHERVLQHVKAVAEG